MPDQDDQFQLRPSRDGSPIFRMRHSTAHVLAQAVLHLFPGTKLGIGPAIEDGFYYDFDSEHQFSTDDFPAIEAEMHKIIKADYPFVLSDVQREKARRYFAEQNQVYKVDLIDGFSESERITFYTDGDFVDLCAGPHVESTGKIKAFKLRTVAGAYWRGNAKNSQLQRIYGVGFETSEEVDRYFRQLEEARKRDHRRLGKELGLFVLSDDVGPGIPLFFPKGEMLRHLMEGYVREVQTRRGYQHVWTGHLARTSLYKKSGHFDAYRESMFPFMQDDDDEFVLKPMNCPSHMTLFNQQQHSYRELPLRYAEFATLYRYEKSGELSGLARVRSVTQDDCHIFCTEEQVQEEFERALALIREVLGTYGFESYWVRLSLRGEGEKYIAGEEKWARSEEMLRDALENTGVDYVPVRGEAAIYGPKADFITKDVLGRDWQISTIQVDMIQPARLGCTYIGEDGQEHTPVLLHRAVTGATERFLALLIEHFAGVFPLWLSPVQAVVIPIADRHNDYGMSIAARLRDAGIRTEVDNRREGMRAKIRDAQLQKVPYMLVVGDREQQQEAVSVRLRSGQDLGATPVASFIAMATQLIESRSLQIAPES
ncbi:MAG: threonine--tRNA ligase [Chloroflexi bacterium]|nr:threonine--tRNA ligase [Chloroflexota bacterium]